MDPEDLIDCIDLDDDLLVRPNWFWKLMLWLAILS